MSDGLHWDGISLYDADYQVGQVIIIDKKYWRADPFWAEESHFFDTQIEAKSWLVSMYRLGGGTYVQPRTNRKTS